MCLERGIMRDRSVASTGADAAGSAGPKYSFVGSSLKSRAQSVVVPLHGSLATYGPRVAIH